MERLGLYSMWLFLWGLLALHSASAEALQDISFKSPSHFDFRAPFNWPVARKPTSEVLLDHKHFQISYNQVHLLANWVFYKLSSQKLANAVAVRRDHFISDPILVSLEMPYLGPKAFKGSRYDRGHMAPSADFLWDQNVNDLTFVMSNMAPQRAWLNRFAWRYLEQRVRGWACAEKELQVVVGPVLENGLSRLPSGVSVPERFFKIVLDMTPPRKAVGFIYWQEDNQDIYRERAMAVDEVEDVIGFDVFSDLEISEQTQIESHFDLSEWSESKCKKALSEF